MRKFPEPRQVAAVATTAIACWAAIGPIGSTYAPGPAPLLLYAAAAGGVAVTAGLRAVRLAASTAILTALLVLCGVLVGLGTWLPRPAGPLPGAVLEAVRYSGARLLTTSVPLPVSLETVALPLCATWLAASAATALLFGRRPVLAVAPPVVLLGAAVAVVGPTSRPAYGFAILLVAALIVLFALTHGTRVSVVATAAFTALAGVTVAVAAPVLLSTVERRPPDLRAHVDPPYQNPEQRNPLSMLAGWAANPEQPLLEVLSDRPARLRLVTLTEFTGVTWLPARTYQAAGTVLPGGTQPEGPPVRQQVTVTGLEGGWLPVPDGTRMVTGVRVAVDAGTSTLVAPDGLHPGLRYAVQARPPAWDTARLATASLATDEELDLARTLPPGGPGRLFEVARAAAGTGSPYEQARRLADHLRRTYTFDAQAPGGNGYPSLDRFLLQPAEQGGGRGSSEQFSTAFAVLARTLGMPSRVVVGFDLGQPSAGNRYEVRAGDALAWPEVHLAGVGWVPFDPTPAASPSDDLLPAPAEALPSPTGAPDTAEEERSGPNDENRPDQAAPPLPTPPAGRTGWGWPLPVAVAALVLLGGVPLARLWRAAARLGRAEPARLVLGAWAEVRDGLRLTGRRLPRSATVDEIAAVAAEATGGLLRAEVDALATAVNAAAFGGQPPDRADAERLVAGVRRHRRALRRRAGRIRRLLWWYDPRPLWWR